MSEISNFSLIFFQKYMILRTYIHVHVPKLTISYITVFDKNFGKLFIISSANLKFFEKNCTNSYIKKKDILKIGKHFISSVGWLRPSLQSEYRKTIDCHVTRNFWLFSPGNKNVEFTNICGLCLFVMAMMKKVT